MPTKVKPETKKKTQYTRITIDDKLKKAIEKVQESLPLYSTNDVINYLISLGYKQMEQTIIKKPAKGNVQAIVDFLKTHDLGGQKASEVDQFVSNRKMYDDYYKAKYGE